MKFIKFFFLILTNAAFVQAYNVGLLIVATGPYIQFVQPLINSANKHFCKKHHVTYFVFTDASLTPTQTIVPIYQKKLGWPQDTMMRPVEYLRNWPKLETMDYLFSCDADMLFCDEVGDEILEYRVGTLHPGFLGRRGSPETNPISKAYIVPGTNSYYFAGGFWGGCREEFLKITRTIALNIVQDLAIGHIAVWHDESHLNHYFHENPPTKILSPAYCYAEGYNLPFPKKLSVIEKKHAEFQK